jgi:eukaryotic-like serine/threonine-protein kinase
MSNSSHGKQLHLQTLSMGDRIDVICDAYEEELLHGKQPDLRGFLTQIRLAEGSTISGRDCVTLFEELLLLDVDYRKRVGEVPSIKNYLDAFPEFSECIEAVELKLSPFGSQDTRDKKETAGDGDMPDRIAHFMLLEKLGAGAAGEVWKARDTRLQRIVAIKIPHAGQHSGEQMHRFVREGRAAAQVRHPYIVTVYEAGREDSLAYIVSEYIAGECLQQALKKQRLDVRRAAELCEKIAEALHHAHMEGVIHRDLKPANVMLDEQGKPHVADFGLAKWSEDAREMTLQGQLLGTLAYMAPEQARGDAVQVDGRADVYALGGLLYEMLAGKPPFRGDMAIVLNAVLHEEPPTLRSIDASIPRDLETICQKAMQKEVGLRYSSALEMADDLRRYLRGDPIRARPLGRIEKSWRAIRRRPAIPVAVLFAAIAVTAILFSYMLKNQNRQLLGLRPVSLLTKPAGARVTFIPLNDATNEPVPEKMVRAEMLSPIETELTPGDYLVVAVLDDGRFHEVYRHVPKPEENVSFHHKHRHWVLAEDGRIELPGIRIPDRTVLENMALIERRETEKDANETDAKIADEQRLASIFIDFCEVSVADFKQTRHSPPNDKAWTEVSDSHALAIRYDDAVALAEDLGKRLPTIEEYEFVAKRQGRSRWPWGASDPPEDPVEEFGPVGQPTYDALLEDPRVIGLVSNVAEWTTSAGFHLNPEQIRKRVAAPLASDLDDTLDLGQGFHAIRIVAGGDEFVISGKSNASANHRDPMVLPAMFKESMRPGLGFRCVRSASPRDVPEAF